MGSKTTDSDRLYEQAIAEFGPAIVRLSASYEANPERRRDLLQDIHVALWRSFAGYKGECALRTWVYRIGHNVAASYALREKRTQISKWVAIEDAALVADVSDVESEVGASLLREKLLSLIQQLRPPDRQIVHLYLEGLEASAIAEITSFSPANIASKIHRLKAMLGRAFQVGDVP